MGYEDEGSRGSYGGNEKGKEGSKGRENRDAYHSDRRSEKIGDVRSVSSAKDDLKLKEKAQNPRSRDDGNARVRVGARESGRRRHRDKAGRHADDAVDDSEEVNGKKNKEAHHSQERTRDGRRGDARAKASTHESGGYSHKDKAGKHEEHMVDDLEEVNGEERMDASKEAHYLEERARDSSRSDDRFKNKDTSKLKEDMVDLVKEASVEREGDGSKLGRHMAHRLKHRDGGEDIVDRVKDANTGKDVDGSRLGRHTHHSEHLDGREDGAYGSAPVRDGVSDREKRRQKRKDVIKLKEGSIDSMEDANSGKHGSLGNRHEDSRRHLDGHKESGRNDNHVRESSNERERHRHIHKADKYRGDVADKIDDTKIGRHDEGFKEKISGKHGERSRDVDNEKNTEDKTEHHYHGSNKMLTNETDHRRHHHSGHKESRKESEGDDMQEELDRKEKGKKRKEFIDDDDDNLRNPETGDRLSKRRKGSLYSEKSVPDGKDKGEKRKRDDYEFEKKSSAEVSVKTDPMTKLPSMDDEGKQLSQANDVNGLLSASNEPLVSTMGFQQVALAFKTTSNIAQPLPPAPSRVPSTMDVLVDSKNIDPSKTDSPHNSSKVGVEGSSGGVKASDLSLDALMKAKKALQMQKELSEKLKKLPQLNKAAMPPSTALTPSAALPLAASGAATASMLSGTGAQNPSTEAANTSTTGIGGGSGFGSGMMPGMPGVLPNLGTISNYEAVKRAQEYVVRLGFQQPPGSMPLLGVVPPHGSFEAGMPSQPKSVKAPVLRLDAHGREIDEHGNIVDRPKVANVSTLKVNINKQKKEAFQILHPELDDDPVTNPFFDPRMGIDRKKLVRPKRSSFQFVEEGKWSKQAEIMKLNSQFGEAKAKEIKAKQAALAKAKAEADINPNLIEVVERMPVKEKPPKDPIPDVEWWDAVLLLSGSYKDATEGELKVKMEKLTIYVEHPVPIEPPAEPLPPPPQPLKLTKRERKKLRTQRRLAKEKDRQEMIRQGLLEPPKSKVKMSNLMKVLGVEATQDPTRLEREIRTAAAEREQAHTDRNLARKLTPAERRDKKEKKLFDDPNMLETIVSVYRINDLSHPQLRFKVDVNAQENRLTGCAVMCDALTVVIVEGGSKAIKRYSKLMLRRIDWATAVMEEDQGEETKPHQINKCSLVWQGSVAKAAFDRFLIQQCRTEAAARKFLADAGVAHYWDLAVNFTEE